jgi:hypothetical protein
MLSGLLVAPVPLLWWGLAAGTGAGSAVELRRASRGHGWSGLLAGTGLLVATLACLAAGARSVVPPRMATVLGATAVVCGGAALLIVLPAVLLRGRQPPRR